MAVSAPNASLVEVPALAAGTPVEGQYIVVFNPGQVPRPSTKAFVRGKAVQALSENGVGEQALDHVYEAALTGFSARLTRSEADKLKKDPRVAYIEQDRVITIAAPKKDPGKPGGSTPPAGQTIPWGITRVGGPTDGTGKTAWIIDTGIDLDHPDLNVDVARSISYVSRDPDPDDKNGHGTHVAGTVAALDNSIGVVGVAAGATVVSVRVLDRRGSGTYSGVIAGVNHVAGNGAPGDAANMSLGGPVSQALDEAVVTAAQTGVKFALAAGNEQTDANTKSPARANGENIYTVSACTETDAWAYFSNFGNPPVDFAAPGVYILSLKKGGDTTTMSGTSMAAPHVAGLLLLGTVNSDGAVSGDPDGNPDPIAHR